MSRKATKLLSAMLAGAMLASSVSLTAGAAVSVDDNGSFTLVFKSDIGHIEGDDSAVRGFSKSIRLSGDQGDIINLNDLIGTVSDDCYVFSGWREGSDIVETIEMPLSGYSYVYAEWDAPEDTGTWSAILNPGEGTIAGETAGEYFDGGNYYLYKFDESTLSYDSLFALPVPELDGAEFVGWNAYYRNGEMRSDESVTPGHFYFRDTYEFDAYYRMQASEEDETGRIDVYGNGGTIDGQDMVSYLPVYVNDRYGTVSQRTEVYVPDEREGYTFIGWNTEPDGSGPDVDYVNSYSFNRKPENYTEQYRIGDEDGNIRLYAKWKKNVFTPASDADHDKKLAADLNLKIAEYMDDNEPESFYRESTEDVDKILEAYNAEKVITAKTVMEKSSAEKTEAAKKNFEDNWFGGADDLEEDAYHIYVSVCADGEEIARFKKLSGLLEEITVSLPEELKVEKDKTGRTETTYIFYAFGVDNESGREIFSPQDFEANDGLVAVDPLYDNWDYDDFDFLVQIRETGKYTLNFDSWWASHTYGGVEYEGVSRQFNFLYDGEEVQISELFDLIPDPPEIAPYAKFIGWGLQGEWNDETNDYDYTIIDSVKEEYFQKPSEEYQGPENTLTIYPVFDKTPPKGSGKYYLVIDLGSCTYDNKEYKLVGYERGRAGALVVFDSDSFESIVLPDPMPYFEGESTGFVGWNPEVNEAGDDLVFHSSTVTRADFADSDVFTIHAFYKKPTEKENAYLALHAEGGLMDGEETKYYAFTAASSGDVVSFYLYIPKRSGFKFIGWNTKADGSGEWISEDGPYSMWLRGLYDEDNIINLYAQWEEKTPAGLKGDVTGDGTTDIGDALQVARYDAGLVDFTAEQIAIGDIDGGGTTDIGDALQIARYDAGLRDTL